MALRLQIISEQKALLGDKANIVFGVGGGSLGRASDNDWVLPDPRRYLSGHHARIHFRQGAFYLEDTSTNGIFVNGASIAVARGGPHALKHGDVLRFGEYEVGVEIDAAESTGTGTGAVVASAIERITPLRSAGRRIEDDLGASLNFDALIHADGFAAALANANEQLAGKADEQAQLRVQRLRAAARARLEGQSPQLHDTRSGFDAFCRGAGIDPQQLPPDASARSLHLAGQLLREAMLGLQELVSLATGVPRAAPHRGPRRGHRSPRSGPDGRG